MKEIHIEQVRPRPEQVAAHIGAQVIQGAYVGEKYRLMSEPDGYVFRRFNEQRFGHSGRHKTRTEAVYAAIAHVPGTKVYEFETKEDLDLWGKE